MRCTVKCGSRLSTSRAFAGSLTKMARRGDRMVWPTLRPPSEIGKNKLSPVRCLLARKMLPGTVQAGPACAGDDMADGERLQEEQRRHADTDLGRGTDAHQGV